jgi:hypothetical protein
MGKCYYCGENANDADDHVPPEALYTGFNKTYKCPDVISVPSCTRHNLYFSKNDDLFAHLIVGMASPSNNASTDVLLHMTANISVKAMKDPFFADDRLAQWGMRLLRKSSDYDSNGKPVGQKYDKQWKEKTVKGCHERLAFLDFYAKRIAVGLYYFQTGGAVIGELNIGNITVLWPTITKLDKDGKFYSDKADPAALLSAVFGKMGPVIHTDVISGSKEVFSCTLSCVRNLPTRFVAKFVFFESVECYCLLKDSA